MADSDVLRELLRRRIAQGPPLEPPLPVRTPAMLLSHHLEVALTPLLPAAARSPELEEAVTRSRRRTAHLLMELERILPPLENAGCAPVVLKGAGLALAFYPDALDRWFVDLDVLVIGTRIETACEVLYGLGYTPIEPERFATYYDRYHLHRALVGPSRAVVELHWDLTIPLSVYSHDPVGVQERAVTVPLGRRTCRVASAVDQVVHGIYQNLADGFAEARRVLDLAYVMPTLGEADWRLVVRLARDGRLERALALWLEVARDLGGLEVPTAAPDGSALGRRARRLLRNLDVAGGTLFHRARVQPSYARFVHLVLVPGWRLRLRELGRLLLPGEFHLQDAGLVPGRWRGWPRRLRLGLRNAEGLLRVLVRALGF